MISFLVDTSFLISFADPGRPNHAAATAYFREALQRGVPLYFSAIAASEFQVKQAVTDLPLRNFVALPFNFDHAMTAGLLMRELDRESSDRRDVVKDDVKDDVKLIAQAVCESVSHILTEDRQTLSRYVQRFNDAGRCDLTTILLADGFDAAWFNGGSARNSRDLRWLPSPHTRRTRASQFVCRLSFNSTSNSRRPLTKLTAKKAYRRKSFSPNSISTAEPLAHGEA